MPKNCLDGYLTIACSICPDWADGTEPEKGFGCATSRPIMDCPFFRKMFEDEEEEERKSKQDK